MDSEILRMNRLKVRTRVSREGEYKFGGSFVDRSLWTEILVDDELLLDFEGLWLAVDLGQLTLSLQGDGEFFILTCTCGVADCAGLTTGVQVYRDAENVHWVVREPGPTRTLVFDGEAYPKAIKQGLAQFEQRCAQHPGMEIVPMQNRYLLGRSGGIGGLP
jgi:hypothetical protein